MGHILLKIKKSLFFFILIKICFTDIICTTTIISSVIKDLTENKIKVTTVVSSGICPGHADIRIADLKVIEKDKVLFAHGFEPYLEKIKKTIKNSNLKIVIIETKGNLLIPENQKILYEKIKDELIKIYPDYEKLLQQNLNKKKKEIDNVEIEIKRKLEKYKGKKTICNKYIKDLVEYFGFKVIDVYGRKEDLTPVKIKELIEKCKREKVDIVIDNLQAGKDTGKIFAEEIKVPHVAISNFPGVFKDTETLKDTLYANFKKILSTIEKWEK